MVCDTTTTAWVWSQFTSITPATDLTYQNFQNPPKQRRSFTLASDAIKTMFAMWLAGSSAPFPRLVRIACRAEISFRSPLLHFCEAINADNCCRLLRALEMFYDSKLWATIIKLLAIRQCDVIFPILLLHSKIVRTRKCQTADFISLISVKHPSRIRTVNQTID